MAAIGSAVASFFTVEGAATAVATDLMGATVTAGAGAGAAGAISGVAAWDAAMLGATAGSVGAASSIGGALLNGAGQAAGGAAVSSLLAPKRPELPKPQRMPDPLATQEAMKKSLIEQTARRGRASTVLTDAAGDKLGG